IHEGLSNRLRIIIPLSQIHSVAGRPESPTQSPTQSANQSPRKEHSMQTTAQDLFSQLLEFGESARLEAKRGSQISDSVMQTVCAFANEPGLEGGYLLLGVSEPDAQHDNYHVSGVTDVDQLLNELHNNCRSQFEQPV